LQQYAIAIFHHILIIQSVGDCLRHARARRPGPLATGICLQGNKSLLWRIAFTPAAKKKIARSVPGLNLPEREV
jgi:hypothetical protein